MFMAELGDKVSELAKRRGFFFQSSEAYGGVAGFQSFGPEGAELKRKVEDSWRKRFSTKLGHREIDAPTVMPEPVFEASGHLDGFDDMIVKCPECSASIRADHLVENNTDIDEAEGLSTDQIEVLIEDHDLFCTSCGHELTGEPVEEFNLMFETGIGPGNGEKGYLRPETAQGIFVEFPRLKEYARQLPFGITQIGKAYRNEISPRKGLVRTREFTQAELEHFIDPENDDPDLSSVKDVELKLYPAENQRENSGYVYMTVEEAVEQEAVQEWVAYYLGVAKKWYVEIGLDMDRFRFRQHQKGERAHYAEDCWDAEADIGSEENEWLEIAGFAYRGDYDLSKHSKHSGDGKDFQVFREYDEPRVREVKELNPDMGYFGPEFGEQSEKVVEKLEELVKDDPDAFEDDEVMIELDGENFMIPAEKAGFETKEVKESGEHFTPHVVEPSFGVDRTVYALILHAFEEDRVDEEERTVLKFKESVAPTQVAVFPLMNKEGLGEKAREVAEMLREEGLSVKYDDTGNIGKRYRRQDEVGTPYCVTVDYETLEEEPETVTVRDRDSTEQERVKIEKLGDEISSRL